MPTHPGGVTQSSGSEISISCETVATHESTLQMSSWSHSNLVSTLPSGRFIVDHAIEFSKLRVRIHYSTLHGWNSWQWCRTSHIHNCNQWNSPDAHTPCCQLPSVTLRVCSIGWRGKLGCISFTRPSMWQSLFLCTPRLIQLSSSFLSTCNWTSPKSDWAAPVTLTKKGRKASKAWWHDDADE